MGDLVLGILIGVLLFSTGIVAWQLFVTFRELTETIRAVRHLQNELEADLKSTAKEIHQIMAKVNTTMDGVTGIKDGLENAAKSIKQTMGQVKKVLFKTAKVSKDYCVILGTGVSEGVNVLLEKNEPAPLSNSPLKEEIETFIQ